MWLSGIRHPTHTQDRQAIKCDELPLHTRHTHVFTYQKNTRNITISSTHTFTVQLAQHNIMCTHITVTHLLNDSNIIFEIVIYLNFSGLLALNGLDEVTVHNPVRPKKLLTGAVRPVEVDTSLRQTRHSSKARLYVIAIHRARYMCFGGNPLFPSFRASDIFEAPPLPTSEGLTSSQISKWLPVAVHPFLIL